MTRLLGIGLLLLGVYLLGQNIIFVTHVSPYMWREIPVGGSVWAIMGGVIMLSACYSSAQLLAISDGFYGCVGAVLVFLSGGIILRATSLWEFFIAFVALAGGFQLMTSGSIRF